MDCNNHLKIEQEDDTGVGEDSVDRPPLFPGDTIHISEQFNQFLQMTTNGLATGNSASAMNVYLNLLLQQMLSNIVGNNSNKNQQEADDNCSSDSSHQDHLSSSDTKQSSVDAGIQTNNDEFGIHASAHDAAVRDTLALELGTILAKKFWPQHYLREDKLKLMVDVIGKLLGC